MFDEMHSLNENGKIVLSNNCGNHNGKVMSLAEKEWTENTIGTTFREIWGRYVEEIVNGIYHINAEERKILKQIFQT